MSLRADLVLKPSPGGNLTCLTLLRPFNLTDLHAIFEFANGLASGQVLIALPSDRTWDLDLYFELAIDGIAFCEDHEQLPGQFQQSSC